MSSSQAAYVSSPISPSLRRTRRSKFTYKNLSTLSHYSTTSPLRVIAHIDLDAFYAQCEMVRLDVPPDQPLAVQQWQGLIAINYPARAYGLSRHVTITEAKEKCPDIICQHVATWKEGDTKWSYTEDAWKEIATRKVSLDPYRIESRKILAVIKEGLPAGERQRVEKASIDEVFLDLSAHVHALMLERYPELRGPPPYDDPTEPLPRPPTTVLDWAADALVDLDATQSEEDDPDWDDIAMLIASEIVRDVRKQVFEKLKYTCSAGIGKNKMLAKLGSGHKKPNRQTVIRNRAVGKFLSGFKFTKIRNLGGKLGDEVVAGFNTDLVSELLPVGIEQLKKQLGDETGAWLFGVLRGEDHSEVNPRTQIKSMLSAKSFRPSINTMEVAGKWLRIFVADIYGRLVEEGVLENKRRPKTVNLHHRQGQQSRSKQMAIPMGKTITEEVLFDLAKRLLAQVIVDGRAWPCSNLSLSVGGFEDGVKDNLGIGGFLVRGEEAKAMKGSMSAFASGGGSVKGPAKKKRRIKAGGIPTFFSHRWDGTGDDDEHEESVETPPPAADDEDERDEPHLRHEDSIDDFHDNDYEEHGIPPEPAETDTAEQSTLPPSFQPQPNDTLPSTPPEPPLHDINNEHDTCQCPRCGKFIPQTNKIEHDDFHFAQDLQDERSSPPPRPPPPKAVSSTTKNSSKPKGRGRPPGGASAGGVEKGQRRLAFG